MLFKAALEMNFCCLTISDFSIVASVFVNKGTSVSLPRPLFQALYRDDCGKQQLRSQRVVLITNRGGVAKLVLHHTYHTDSSSECVCKDHVKTTGLTSVSMSLI